MSPAGLNLSLAGVMLVMAEHGKRGISRRTMLKRIGAGTAVAWSAPILSSIRTPAFAQYPTECQPGQDSCEGPEFPCEGRGFCFCTGTKEGGIFCGCFDQGGCGDYQLCGSSAECPAGRFCTTEDDCCGGICVRPCGPDCGGQPRVTTSGPVPPYAA